jgi:outer membrane protein OmpA-like peptidoglycan-associated protein
MYSIGKGLNWNRSTNFHNNSAWNTSYRPGIDPVFYNYKTNVQDLSLEGLFTLNSIRFHKSKTGLSIYGLVGVGAATYDTKVNALNANNQPYTNFASVTGTNVYSNRKNIRDQLKGILDDTYETDAETHGERRARLGDNTLIPVGHVGGGIAFRLSRRLNLAIEDRFTITRDDLIDGQRWAEQVNGNPVLTPEYDSYNRLTVGLNINLGAKSVEPLWWLNPLDYAYQEIRKPRLMILPKPTLPDTDGDGVTDQFDQEQTPAGCPVDTHGVSLDTDGDGVPDCRDKEKVTPTSWQPVDADGVGKMPCPDSTCLTGLIRGGDCATLLGDMPSIAFRSGSSLTSEQRTMLAGVASRLRNSPNCRLTIVSYCTDSKSKQQSGNARAEAIRRHLVEREGISNDRISVLTGQQGGDCNTIDLRGE